MNYKVVSKNKELLNKSHHIFTALGLNEAIHIQEVDFWLIDVKDMDESAITSYKIRTKNAFLLFVINDDNDIKICLQHGFCNYMHCQFTQTELSAWHKFYLQNQKNQKLRINDNCLIDFQNALVLLNNTIIALTLQELALLKALSHAEFVTTSVLCSILRQNSPTSVRTIINRLRSKTDKELIVQKRDYGYKLNIQTQTIKPMESSEAYIKELEEQNALIQEIVDSSSIFIATFVHKQLHCINKSFRDFLGTDIIKELWDETKGDFFQLIEHSSSHTQQLKSNLFDKKGKTQIKLYDFEKNSTNEFEVQTFYFENLDKHLLIFNLK